MRKEKLGVRVYSDGWEKVCVRVRVRVCVCVKGRKRKEKCVCLCACVYTGESMIAYGLVHSCIWAGFLCLLLVEEKERDREREREGNRGVQNVML